MNLSWTDRIVKFLRFHVPESPAKIQKGIYAFRRESNGNITRFHLRIEEDGAGLLLANSSVAARLSPSGTWIAKSMLEDGSLEEVRRSVKENFRSVDEKQLETDLQKLSGFIETLANPEDNYPIFNLDDPAATTPRSLFAPFHAQLTVASPEKTNPLLQKLWESGIIHVTFAALRDSSAEDAVKNIERAEDTGMISGLRTVASWLQGPDLLQRIAMAGVDYMTVPILSPHAEKHDSFLGPGDFSRALQILLECKKWEVCPVVEIPIFRENSDEIESLLNLLGEHSVRNVLYYAIPNEHPAAGLSGPEIIQSAVEVHELAHQAEVRYVWLPPVSRAVDLKQLLADGPWTAGDISIRVEPDGSVYPARGPRITAGNLLAEDWPTIWKQEVFRKYRQRVESATRCDVCPGLEICAADCPADPAGWARGEEK
jgi:radical SAM protein with 4Fe4S-binding SPASM domain